MCTLWNIENLKIWAWKCMTDIDKIAIKKKQEFIY